MLYNCHSPCSPPYCRASLRRFISIFLIPFLPTVLLMSVAPTLTRTSNLQYTHCLIAKLLALAL